MSRQAAVAGVALSELGSGALLELVHRRRDLRTARQMHAIAAAARRAAATAEHAAAAATPALS